MNQSFEYHFEWDPAKARANYKKHSITFERATSVFNDSNALSIFDENHSFSEERWVTLGLDYSGVPIVICHTYQQRGEHDAFVRIISARKATKKEIQNYKEG